MMNHPYFPRSIELENFSPQVWTVTAILGVFTIAVLTVVGGTWMLSGKPHNNMTFVAFPLRISMACHLKIQRCHFL
jgi:hypothetical protein